MSGLFINGEQTDPYLHSVERFYLVDDHADSMNVLQVFGAIEK